MRVRLVMFILLKETLAPVFVLEDVTEALKQMVVIGHVIWEFFVMDEYIFDASGDGFTSGIMGLTVTGNDDDDLIGSLALFNVIVK